MGIDLSSVGFVIENEWYWKITESATTLGATSVARDFLAPLARLAKARFAIEDIEIDADDRGIRARVASQAIAIRLVDGASDRIAINAFVGDLNRAFAASKLGYSFALVAPRRYELRGVLMTDAEIAALLGDPVMLVPSTRPSWRA